jgi:hypothetical protein
MPYSKTRNYIYNAKINTKQTLNEEDYLEPPFDLSFSPSRNFKSKGVRPVFL